MKYLLIMILGIGVTYADPVDEALLLAASTAGNKVYFACIVTPPVTAGQKAVCAGLYTTYNGAISAVNAPLPLVPSIDPDPYAWSPYDICRFETGHIVFGNQLSIPYCPTV